MSSVGADPSIPGRPTEWDRLELAVRRLLDDHNQWRRRARLAERKVKELEATLREVSAGALDPRTLSARVEALEAENRELRDHLEQARGRVQGIMARLQFLEDGR